MPGHHQGYPGQANNPGLMDALDKLLQDRFTQLESRLEAKFGNRASRNEVHSDLKENLIRIEEKVSSFQNIFVQIEHLTKTADAILVHVKATSGDNKSPSLGPTKPGGININLLPSKPIQSCNNDGLSVVELQKTSADILSLVRAIDSKVISSQGKFSSLEAQMTSLQSKLDGDQMSALSKPINPNNENSNACTAERDLIREVRLLLDEKLGGENAQADFKDLLQEKLNPLQVVSDKLDSLIKQVKKQFAKITVVNIFLCKTKLQFIFVIPGGL